MSIFEEITKEILALKSKSEHEEEQNITLKVVKQIVADIHQAQTEGRIERGYGYMYFLEEVCGNKNIYCKVINLIKDFGLGYYESIGSVTFYKL